MSGATGGSDICEIIGAKFWAEGKISANVRIPDGFKDRWRGPRDPTMQVPETVFCDTRKDARLLELCNQGLAALKKAPTERDKMEALTQIVSDFMGGTMMLDAVADTHDFMETQKQRVAKKGHIMLGEIKCGLSRHRALLFKFIADRCNIFTTLCRARDHLVPMEDVHAYNICSIDGKEFIPNVMRDVGTFYPVESDMASIYLRVQRGEGRLLYFPNCYLPQHQRPSSAMAREFVPLADVDLGSTRKVERAKVPLSEIHPDLESPKKDGDTWDDVKGREPQLIGLHQTKSTVHPKLNRELYIQQKVSSSVVQVGVDKDFQTVAEAVAYAGQSARVLIDPGVYNESITLDKALFIQGMGEDRDNVVFETDDPTAFLITAKYGRCILQNITIRHRGFDFGVEVRQGSHEIRNCSIMGNGRAAAAFHGNNCEVLMVGNHVTGSAEVGIFSFNASMGTIEGNTVENIGGQGIGVASQAAPTLVTNTISGCGGAGMLCEDTGAGFYVEDNTIFQNGDCGVRITGKGACTFRRNKLYQNAQAGIMVEDTQSTLLEKNDVWDHDDMGMELACTTGLSCRQNKVHDGRGVGVFFAGQGNVTSFEHNDIFKNIGVACMIVEGANPYFCHNDVGYCEAEAIVVGDGGLGRIEDNQLHDNGGSGIVIQEGGCPIIRHNTISRSERCGVAILDGGTVQTMEDNDIIASMGAGVWLGATAGDILIRRHRVSDGESTGMEFCGSENVTVFGNDVSGNLQPGIMLRGARITLNANRIRDGRGDGVCCTDADQSTITANNVFNNNQVGLRLMGFETNPSIEQNHVRVNKQHGFVIEEGASGHINNNEVYGNFENGFVLLRAANAMLSQNKVIKHQVGVLFDKKSSGTLIDNDIQENEIYGVNMIGESIPTMRKNRVHHCKDVGVGIGDEAKGLLEDNEICSCSIGIELSGKALPFIKKNRVYDTEYGITVSDGAGGKIDENRINSITKTGIDVSLGGHPRVYGNKIYNCKGVGLCVRDNGMGEYERNNIYNNVGHNVEVIASGKDEPEKLVMKRNNMYDGDACGLMIRTNSGGEYFSNILKNHSGPGIWIDDFSDPTCDRNEMIYCNIGLKVSDGSQPTCRENSIEKCMGEAAIYVCGDKASGFLEHNTIANHRVPGAIVTDNACPVLRLNNFSKTEGAGIIVKNNARGQLVGNQLVELMGDGIRIETNANPLCKLNNIVRISGHGIVVSTGAGVTADDNEIVASGRTCIMITSMADNVVFTKNRIHDSTTSGLHAQNAGGFILRENDFYSLERTACILEGSHGTLDGNSIRASLGDGIHCTAGDRSTLKSNHVHSMTGSGVRISGAASDPMVEANKLTKNRENGVMIEQGACGQMLDNEIVSNGINGVLMLGSGKPKLIRNRIVTHVCGVLIDRGGGGVLDSNIINEVDTVGVKISGESKPVLTNNEITDVKCTGVKIETGSNAVLEDNEIHRVGRECILIGAKSFAVCRRNVMSTAKDAGISIDEFGNAIAEENRISAIQDSGIAITTAEPFVVRNNIIHHDGGRGLHVVSAAMHGTLENNIVTHSTSMATKNKLDIDFADMMEMPSLSGPKKPPSPGLEATVKLS